MLVPAPVPDYRIDAGELVLRLATRADLPALMALHGDDLVNQYLPYTTWEGPADADSWYEKVEQRHREASAIQFVVCRGSEAQALVGTAILFGFEADNGRAELGYALLRSQWGRGLMSQVLAALLPFCFGELGLRRLDAQVDPRNSASCNLLHKAGFRREGLQSERYKVKGELQDAVLYGLLQRDYLALRDSGAQAAR